MKITNFLIQNQIFYSEYPPIARVEQRRKYKTEFDKDYSEYRKLHTVMEKVRSRFASLKNELHKVHPSERKYKVNILLDRAISFLLSYQLPSPMLFSCELLIRERERERDRSGSNDRKHEKFVINS
jgi:hypothetical protein